MTEEMIAEEGLAAESGMMEEDDNDIVEATSASGDSGAGASRTRGVLGRQ